MAFKKNKAVAIFSLEMSKEQLVNRLFSLESQVDAQSLRTGNMKDSDWEKLIEGAGVIGQSKLIIDDTPGISISELRSKCRKYKLEHGLDIIIIDYLQLMTGSVGKSSESRQQEVSDISRQLKGLARELNVPVVSLSQLSRAVESRPDKRPMLSDLRESGAIEQDADVVMFIYRDEYYNKDSEFKKQAEIIIAKQRNGPVGTVNLAWLGEYTKFANLSRQEDSFSFFTGPASAEAFRKDCCWRISWSSFLNSSSSWRSFASRRNVISWLNMLRSTSLLFCSMRFN